MRTLPISKYTSLLNSFNSSTSTFQVLRTISSPSTSPTNSTSLQKLFILDSSFNPPTLAHLRIATSAILSASTTPHLPRPQSRQRLLLLLATQNADKAPKPASFAQRLEVMEIFAGDILSALSSSPSSSTQQASSSASLEGSSVTPIDIDIALTSLPYFHHKAAAINSSEFYRNLSGGQSSSQREQVHLIGYDTLVRILDPVYYPPAHDLTPLEPFLAENYLRVSLRPGDKWGGQKEQERFLYDLSNVSDDASQDKKRIKGWIRAGRIELVKANGEYGEAISSTKVRDAVQMGGKTALEGLLTPQVAEWVLREGLYMESE